MFIFVAGALGSASITANIATASATELLKCDDVEAQEICTKTENLATKFQDLLNKTGFGEMLGAVKYYESLRGDGPSTLNTVIKDKLQSSSFEDSMVTYLESGEFQTFAINAGLMAMPFVFFLVLSLMICGPICCCHSSYSKGSTCGSRCGPDHVSCEGGESLDGGTEGRMSTYSSIASHTVAHIVRPRGVMLLLCMGWRVSHSIGIQASIRNTVIPAILGKTYPTPTPILPSFFIDCLPGAYPFPGSRPPHTLCIFAVLHGMHGYPSSHCVGYVYAHAMCMGTSVVLLCPAQTS